MRVSEIYLSIQGEGPRVGDPTVFVRFGGCNLRCPGWPCDTQHAIDPVYRDEWLQRTPEQVVTKILKVANGLKRFNICFTGGEPFLQRDGEIDALINILMLEIAWKGTIECFSNGTIAYTRLAHDYVAFIMDWKLPGSGEGTISEVRHDNFMRFDFKDTVKFTIASREDYEEAKRIYSFWQPKNGKPEWYYGVVWSKLDNKKLIEWVLQDAMPWKHTMQIHNIIWDRTQRGI